MKLSQIPWGRAVAAVIAAEAVMVAAAFGWVAIYSHLLRPGETLEFYQEYAAAASPYVALLLGGPVFYAACRWIMRRQAPAVVFGIYCLIEIPILLTESGLPVWFSAVSLPSKLLGCYLGGAGRARALPDAA